MAKKDKVKPGHNLTDEMKMEEIVKTNKEYTPLEDEIKILQKKQTKLLQTLRNDTGIGFGSFRSKRRVALLQNYDQKKKILTDEHLVLMALSPHEQFSMTLDFPELVQDEDDDTNAE